MKPKEMEYALPIIIRVFDKRKFGLLPMVGIHVIETFSEIRDFEDSSSLRQTSSSFYTHKHIHTNCLFCSYSFV